MEQLEMQIYPHELTLRVGETYQLTSEYPDATWLSNGDNIASISENGMVTAHSEGTAGIMAYVVVDGVEYIGYGTITVIDPLKQSQEFKDNRATIVSNLSEHDIQKIDAKTGYLSIEHKDISTSGAILPASVSHIFASVCNNSENTFNCGNGWRLSAHQKVESLSDYECVYTDAVGKKHKFHKTTKKDIDGLNLTFSGTVSGTSYIKDRGGNTMKFVGGNLVEISDKNGNKVTYTYTGDLLTQITDSFNKSLTLTYENGYLKKITDPKGREVKYTYNEQGQLISIEDPDTLTTTYSYSENRIDTINIPTGIFAVYVYLPNSDKVVYTQKDMTISKVSQSEKVSGGGQGAFESQYFAYDDGFFSVSDKYDVETTYILDEDGRCVTKYTQAPGDSHPTLNSYSDYGYKDGRCVFYSTLTADQDGTLSKNLIKNGDFNNGTTDWEKVNCASTDIVVDDAYISGTKSFKFTGSDGTCSLKQRILVSNLPDEQVPEGAYKIKHGNTLTLSAWGRLLNTNYIGSSEPFKLKATVGYADGSTDTSFVSAFSVTTSWQHNLLPIRIDVNKTVEYVDVSLEIYGGTRYVLFNDVRLVNTISDTVKYEEDLNETVTIFGEEKMIKQRVTEDNGIVRTITENGENYRPLKVKVKYIDSDEFTSVFKYDENSNLIASQDYHGNVTLNEYNSKGNVTRTRAYHSDSFNTADSLTCPVKCFVKEYTYDTNGEYMEEESDQRSEDIKAQYNYDKNAGLLNYDIDNNGQKTSYTYDQNTHAPTSVSALLGMQDNRVDYSYNNRFLTAITHNGFDYLFEYDGFGRRTKVTAGDCVLSTTEYDGTTVDTILTTYGNGKKYLVTCDKQRRPVKKENVTGETPVTVWEKKYDDVGNLVEYIDKKTNVTYNYTYDELGNLVSETESGGDNINPRTKAYEYDNANRLSKTTLADWTGSRVYTPEYEKTENGKIYPSNTLKKLTLENTFTQEFTRDNHRRIVKDTLTTIPQNETTPTLALQRDYAYLEQNNRLTTLVDTVISKVNNVVKGNLKYTYDNNGNITVITDISGATPTVVCEYYYDGLNRLTRENNYLLNATYSYQYDNAGNIIYKNYHNLTTGNLTAPFNSDCYYYKMNGWKDQLVAIEDNNGRKTITYDAVGNPLTYLGHSLEWTDVRRLKKFDNVSFTYNEKGVRTQKGDVFYSHIGNMITLEERYAFDSIAQEVLYTAILYRYGKTGVEGFSYNGQSYYFLKNLQGDVTHIYRQDGTLVGQYIYDAWGNHTIVTDVDGIASLNPFRYRGYYYDVETGLYYLKTRYYDPTTGRFINADGLVSTGQGLQGYNMYSYCNNNPVLLRDSTGTRPIASATVKDETAIERSFSSAFMKGYDVTDPEVVAPILQPKKLSDEGLDFIVDYEGGFRSNPYDDGYGNMTIGYGHKILPNEEFTEITQAQAKRIFANDLGYFERKVTNYSNSLGIVWEQNEYDAFVSLAYNSGNNFKYVMNEIVDGTDPHDSFAMIIKSNGEKSLGLYRRRMDEADIFVYGTYNRTYRGWPNEN